MKKALITGITGQDGSYLAELLLEKGYEVHGLVRRSSSFNTGRIDRIFDRLHLHFGDLLDRASLTRILAICEPDEIYNLGAQSHVRVSFDIPEHTHEVIATGTHNLLGAVWEYGLGPRTKIYQASSSEMFGNSAAAWQNEETPFHPVSPYGMAKATAHRIAQQYRDGYGMHICCGVLFNHESPRRGETFVTRKITRAATRIKVGLQDRLVLGNLGAHRDWGYAPEYVEAMWMMLQRDTPDDYVIGTGKTYPVSAFVAEVFRDLELDPFKYVQTDDKYQRPIELDYLCADAAKARSVLRWRPKVDFVELAKIMVNADMALALTEQTQKRMGVVKGADWRTVLQYSQA